MTLKNHLSTLGLLNLTMACGDFERNCPVAVTTEQGEILSSPMANKQTPEENFYPAVSSQPGDVL